MEQPTKNWLEKNVNYKGIMGYSLELLIEDVNNCYCLFNTDPVVPSNGKISTY